MFFLPNHLHSKFDKKAIHCIFVEYDSQHKGWKCCDPTTGQCHVSRNVVCDEASSWWSPQAMLLPDSKKIKEQLQQCLEDHVEIKKVQPTEEAEDITKHSSDE